MLEPTIIVQRYDDYEPFEKEDIKGFQYRRIFTKRLPASTVDFVLLELLMDADRDKVTTEAFEYKYVLRGEVEYIINSETYHLSEGDSIFFDGRLPHVPKNHADTSCLMLIAYFFDQD